MAKKKSKKKIITSIILLGLAVLIVLFIKTRKAPQAMYLGYTEYTVGLNDLKESHTFTGTIAPDLERNIVPEVASVKIKEVLIEQGDEVKEGDPLFVMDSSNIEDSIRELEASINASSISSELSVELAKKSYNDYKSNLDNNLNQTILNSEQQLDAAFAALLSAQQAFNNEVALNEQGLSSTVLNAVTSMENAYGNVRVQQENYSQAEKAADDYKKEHDDEEDTKLENAKDSAKIALDNAWTSYHNTELAYEAATINEQNNITSLYSQLIKAQVSYLSSIDNYNASVTAANQQLETLGLQVKQSEAAGNIAANLVKLENLNKQIDDCVVRSPIDGVVTVVNAKVGDSPLATAVLATVADLNKMKINIKINEYDTLGVAEGKEVDINVNALDKTYKGKLANISRVASVENGVSYFNSEVVFDADDLIRSGMSVEVVLTLTDLKGTMSIPKDAVEIDDKGDSYVICRDEKGDISNKYITCGISDNKNIQVLSGLNLGDKILYKEAVNYDMMMGPRGMRDDTRDD